MFDDGLEGLRGVEALVFGLISPPDEERTVLRLLADLLR